MAQFGQEIVRNVGITQLAVERAGPLGSGMEAADIAPSGVQVIFRACEVHVPEYPSGPKFR